MDFLPIIFAFIIISIIIWLWLTSDSQRSARAESYLNKSNGTADKDARNALQEIKKIKKPTAQDKFNEGEIYAYNILEGEADRDLNTAAHAINAFDRALNDNEVEVHMVARVHDFVENQEGIAHLMNPVEQVNRYLARNREHNGRNHDTNGNANEIAVGLRVLAGNVNTANENLRQKRKKPAATKSLVSKNFLDESIKHTNDRQNVHDSSVQTSLNKTYKKLNEQQDAATAVKPMTAFQEAHQYANNITDPKRKANVLRALNSFSVGSTQLSNGSTEHDTFVKVWNRHKHPKNKDMSTNIKDAIMDALDSCIENDSLVCTTGRTSRILGSLATLDFDPEMGKAQTGEAYKNEIYTECKKILDQEIAELKKSDDVELAKAAASYEDPKINASRAAEKKFQEHVGDKYAVLVDSYRDKLPVHVRKTLLEDCLASL